MNRRLILLLLPTFLFGQTNYSDLLVKCVDEQAKVNHFAGTILVTKNDNVLLKKAYGYADKSKNILNTVDTKFQIASITKEFTAACILQLEEKGKLSVNDKISKFFPDFKNGDSITIHMLLCHSSGIKDNWPFRMYYGFTSFNKQKAINFISKQSLLFSPGTKSAYSPLGYFLLGCIIEQASGQTYSEYLNDNIFKILDITNSGCYVKGLKVDNKAKNAKTKKFGYDLSKHENFKYIFSGGMIYSTIEDLYKWDRSYYSAKVISEEFKNKKFTPYKGTFGYGESIDTFQTHYKIRHEGVGDGYTSCIYHYTKDNVCIIMLCNDGVNTFAMPEALSAIVFDKPYELPYIHKAIKIKSVLLDRYTGNYFRPNRALKSWQIIKRHDKLYLLYGNEGGIEMNPESDTKFFLEDGSDRQFEFIVDNLGNIEKTWFIRGGVKSEIFKSK